MWESRRPKGQGLPPILPIQRDAHKHPCGESWGQYFTLPCFVTQLPLGQHGLGMQPQACRASPKFLRAPARGMLRSPTRSSPGAPGALSFGAWGGSETQGTAALVYLCILIMVLNPGQLPLLALSASLFPGPLPLTYGKGFPWGGGGM